MSILLYSPSRCVSAPRFHSSKHLARTPVVIHAPELEYRYPAQVNDSKSSTTTMSAKTAEPFFKGSTGRNSRGLLRLTILCLIAGAAVASRLFSVIRTSLL